VLITNHKGKAQGLVSKIGGIEPISNLDIVFKEKGIDIRVFVAIRFGTSIGYVTNTLIDLIHERVKRVIGKDPDSVAVVVSGIISKNMAKRNIEVMRRYDGK
ncbi:MAG: hypothetical protein RR472_07740, partial [Anaerovoracaceae bacterium]